MRLPPAGLACLPADFRGEVFEESGPGADEFSGDRRALMSMLAATFKILKRSRTLACSVRLCGPFGKSGKYRDSTYTSRLEVLEIVDGFKGKGREAGWKSGQDL